MFVSVYNPLILKGNVHSSSLLYFCSTVFSFKLNVVKLFLYECKGKYSRVGIALSTFAGRSTYVTYILVIVLCGMPSCL